MKNDIKNITGVLDIINKNKNKEEIKNEIIEILKNIKTYTITNIYNTLNNVKYKLQKDKNINYKIIEAPKFNQTVNQEIARTFKLQYAEVIENFVSTMKEKLPESALMAMYHNIKTLKIGYSPYLIINIVTGGFYRCLDNIIKLNPIYVNPKQKRGNYIITHELLHMSSHISDGKNKAIGFHWNKIGRNLNEGYTEILNNRLFGHPIVKGRYNLYAKYASVIEDIIGKDNMTNLYFNANLKGLFDKLSSYSSSQKTSTFLKDLDTPHPILYYKEYPIIGNISARNKQDYRMINYLNEIALNYVDNEVKNGTLSKEEAKVFLENHRKKIKAIKERNELPQKEEKSTSRNKDGSDKNNDSDILQKNYENIKLTKHNNNSYSYKFSPNNDVITPQLNSVKTKKRIKGNISYHFIFLINIILSILITATYLFYIS